jgi:hypothetical protein
MGLCRVGWERCMLRLGRKTGSYETTWKTWAHLGGWYKYGFEEVLYCVEQV